MGPKEQWPMGYDMIQLLQPNVDSQEKLGLNLLGYFYIFRV